MQWVQPPSPRYPNRSSSSRSRSPGARLSKRVSSSPVRESMFPLSHNDEPFRPNHRDNRGIPTLLSPWEHFEDYGIVHPSGCDICSSYMKHVADASYSSHQPAFQIAFQDRKRWREELFTKGLVEGMRRQKETEKDLMEDCERYRYERNQAREELGSVRAQLEASRAECERLEERIKQKSVPVFGTTMPEATTPPIVIPPTTTLPTVAPVSAISPLPPNDLPRSSTSYLDPLRLNDIQISVTPIDLQPSHDLLAPVYPQPSQTTPSSAVTPASPESQLPENSMAVRTFADVLASNQISNGTTSFSQPTSDTSSSSQGWTIVSPPNQKSTKPAKSIKQIQSLIKAAHQPNNYSALTKVKALCSEAHKTPREQKTEVQRFLLSTWRTPDWEHPTSQPKLPTPLNNPRLEDPVETWVAYYSANPSSCPKGIRREVDGRPVLSDMRASRTVARLRPIVHQNDAETREARQRFMAVVTELFSVPGEYENILRRGPFSVSPHISYTPYVGAANEISAVEVAAHFAACGVTITVADNELLPWAREYIRGVDY
ncbi:hypothetical protein BJ138DRAFT_805120 [Hygrophoropsis aurantiaca]|uniref:Uncharacterized protein n=1 Tax=Hygrophoropsis aurantiaca TaxID=72124 RepID=A0ACB8AG86_9AGAM|nr:hypothetical protein BJ138DRAFT_805120 [Hygrophoropsis aurantiaca]